MLQPFAKAIGTTWRDTKGATLLELTILMPVLILLSLGVSEFGRALQHHHVLNKSVRDAARYLSRVAAVCPGGTIDAADVAVARNLALTGYPSGGSPIVSYWTDPATISVSVVCFDNSGGAFRGRAAIPIVRVTATVAYADLGFLGALSLPAFTLTARHEEVVIGE